MRAHFVAALALAILPAAAQEPIVFGGLSIEPPQGWEIDRQDELISFYPAGQSAEAAEAAILVTRSVELPEGGAAAFLEQRLASLRKSGTLQIVDGPDRVEADAADCVHVAWTLAQADGSTLIGYDVAVGAGDGVQLASYVALSAEGFQKHQAVFERFLERASPVAPPAGADLEPATPRAFSGETRTIARFCFELRVPAGWTSPDDFQPAHLFTFATGHRPSDYDDGLVVVCEVQVGEVAGELESWMIGRLAPVGGATGGEAVDRATKDQGAWRLPDGARYAYRRIFESRPGFLSARTPSFMDAYALERSGLTLFVGTQWEVGGSLQTEPDDVRQAALDSYGRFVYGDLQAVAGNAVLSLPPRQPGWDGFLARKGSYRHAYERTGGGSGFSATVSWAASRRLAMDFAAGGTCRVDFEQFFGASGSWIDPAAPLTGELGRFSSEDSSATDGPRPGRYEVRGTGDDDLWILVRYDGGETSFHRLRPDARGEFGTFRPQGVEIDGAIEGTYSEGPGYALYEPPK